MIASEMTRAELALTETALIEKRNEAKERLNAYLRKAGTGRLAERTLSVLQHRLTTACEALNEFREQYA